MLSTIRHRSTTALVLTVTLLGVLLALGSSPSSAETLCSFNQLTDFGAGVDVQLEGRGAIDADGTTFAFVSDGNQLGTNADGNEEIWRFDLTTGLIQVTNTTGGSNDDPVISDDGQRIAFSTNRTIGGLNQDNNRDVFLYNHASGTFTNISASLVAGDSLNRMGDLSGNGSVVVFSSSLDLVGTNADGNREVFYRVVGTSTPVQVTQTTGSTNELPSIDDDGSTIVFRSNGNLDGANADGNFELFRFEVGASGFRQLGSSPDGVGARGSFDLNGPGTVVAYQSDADPVGQNGDRNVEVFRLTLRTEAVSQSFETTVTTTPSSPSISDVGQRLAFVSQGDPLGTNGGEGQELFVDDQPGATTQVTDGGLASGAAASVDEGGTHVAVSSTKNPNGENDDGGEDLFVVGCSTSTQVFTDVATTHPFFDEIGWMAAARISTGFQPGPTYQPSAAVSRAAMSAFMYRLAGEPDFTPPGSPTFGDVSPSHPFFEEIEWMAFEDITTGTPASPKPLYKPANPVSRGAMSAFMFRLAGSPSFPDPPTPTFTDVGTGHPFFHEIEFMGLADISTGFQPGPTYQPGAAVSRQAMSAFMFRLIDGVGVDLG